MSSKADWFLRISDNPNKKRDKLEKLHSDPVQLLYYRRLSYFYDPLNRCRVRHTKRPSRMPRWLYRLYRYILIYIACLIGWSEKQKSWKMQKARADSKSRHTTDFRTVFEIMIGRFVSCEIGQTYFTESGVRFGTLERPDFRSFS